jgi:NADP-dependent 3-hydroxy acid dehydrogenase YdfG
MSEIAIITGASSGIGREVAKLLCKNYQCILVSRRDPEIPNSDWIKTDLSNQLELTKLVEYLSSNIKSVKFLLHGAGVMKSNSSAALSLEDAIQTYMVNTIAPVLITSALSKKISKAKGIAIAISSIASKLEIPGEALYSSSKSALDKAFEIIASDLSRLGGTYVKIHPCMIDTPMTEKLSMQQKEYMNQQRATRSQPSAEDLAKYIASLIDSPHYITGSSLLFGGLKR